MLYIPKVTTLVTTDKDALQTKYNTLGPGFFNIPSFSDGINEHGLVGSNNSFPNYATFNEVIKDGMVNTTTSHTFDYLLTNAKDVSEVIGLAKTINLVFELNDEKSAANHFFFMENKGRKVVLEPELGKLVINDNP